MVLCVRLRHNNVLAKRQKRIKVTKLDMILTPKSISLKEVTVKPDPLRQKGDPLSHNLDDRTSF